MTAPTGLRGNAAIRHITAELLNTADWLALTVRSVSVSTFSDGEPSGAEVWFHSYDDAQAVADYYGVGDRVHANNGDWSLLHLGRAPTTGAVRPSPGCAAVCDWSRSVPRDRPGARGARRRGGPRGHRPAAADPHRRA
jgi:hypothetical protein